MGAIVVDVDADANWECVKLTAVSGNTISGIFTMSHAANASVNLFAYPYLTAIMPPNGMGPNASVNTTTLRFFGDIDNDLVLDYVEYVYDSATDRIMRSVTPVTAGSKSAAVPVRKATTARGENLSAPPMAAFPNTGASPRKKAERSAALMPVLRNFFRRMRVRVLSVILAGKRFDGQWKLPVVRKLGQLPPIPEDCT